MRPPSHGPFIAFQYLISVIFFHQFNSLSLNSLNSVELKYTFKGGKADSIFNMQLDCVLARNRSPLNI